MLTYAPPTTADLAALKHTLGYTGEQMADLAAVAGGQQWRKYTGGVAPRTLGVHMAFFMAARLVLTGQELHKVTEKMRAIGCEVQDITAPALTQPSPTGTQAR